MRGMARGVPFIIAVVTDDDGFSDRLTATLNLERYLVFRTAAGVAWSELCERPWDIAILNVTDASTLITLIRGNEEFRSRFVIAASRSSDERVDLLDCGADEAIDVDFAEEELRARIRAGQRTIELRQSLIVVNTRLALLAITDGLTGLYNHRHFQERLAEQFDLSVNSGAGFSVVLFDLDHFKRVNDEYGHTCGDALLVDVSNLLAPHVRSGDFLARYGGEEFGLILPGTSGTEAFAVAERIRGEVSRAPLLTEQIRVTISGGIAAQATLACRSAAELLRRADEALYRAKRHGRNRIVVARPVRSRRRNLGNGDSHHGSAQAPPP
jgi:two-component system cell cycle response regulator